MERRKAKGRTVNARFVSLGFSLSQSVRSETSRVTFRAPYVVPRVRSFTFTNVIGARHSSHSSPSYSFVTLRFTVYSTPRVSQLSAVVGSTTVIGSVRHLTKRIVREFVANDVNGTNARRYGSIVEADIAEAHHGLSLPGCR